MAERDAGTPKSPNLNPQLGVSSARERRREKMSEAMLAGVHGRGGASYQQRLVGNLTYCIPSDMADPVTVKGEGEDEDEDQNVAAQLKQIKGSFEGLSNSIKDGHNVIIHKLDKLGSGIDDIVIVQREQVKMQQQQLQMQQQQLQMQQQQLQMQHEQLELQKKVLLILENRSSGSPKGRHRSYADDCGVSRMARQRVCIDPQQGSGLELEPEEERYPLLAVDLETEDEDSGFEENSVDSWSALSQEEKSVTGRSVCEAAGVNGHKGEQIGLF